MAIPRPSPSPPDPLPDLRPDLCPAQVGSYYRSRDAFQPASLQGHPRPGQHPAPDPDVRAIVVNAALTRGVPLRVGR